MKNYRTAYLALSIVVGLMLTGISTSCKKSVNQPHPPDTGRILHIYFAEREVPEADGGEYVFLGGWVQDASGKHYYNVRVVFDLISLGGNGRLITRQALTDSSASYGLDPEVRFIGEHLGSVEFIGTIHNDEGGVMDQDTLRLLIKSGTNG